MQLEKKMPSPPWAAVMEERGMVTLYHLNDATSLKVILFFGYDLLLAKYNPKCWKDKTGCLQKSWKRRTTIY